MARLLILTLSSGEAALPVLRQQLAHQSFRDFEHEVIAGLPNRAAHNYLYRTIMDRSDRFDLFLKLDADMTFRSTTALADAIAATDGHPNVQHFAFPVWDCFTEQETLGVHLFRSGVRWPHVTDELFVDPDPPGVPHLVWQGPPAPFVDHGDVVSDFECFSYGVHKFLKVAQRGRIRAGLPDNRQKHARHMENCARIRDLYRRTGAARHRLALAGMMWAMQHSGLSALTNKADLRRVFDEDVCAAEASWKARVDRLSSSLVAWRLALVRSLGPRRAFA